MKIDKEYSHIIFFLESAFCYYEKFSFGSDIILKDVSKVCGLDIEIVNKFINDIDLVQEENLSQKFLDKQYFGEGLTIINNKIIQLTWKSKVGFIYDLDTFEMAFNEKYFNFPIIYFKSNFFQKHLLNFFYCNQQQASFSSLLQLHFLKKLHF